MSPNVKDCAFPWPFLPKLTLIFKKFKRVEQQKYADQNLNEFFGLLCGTMGA